MAPEKTVVAKACLETEHGEKAVVKKGKLCLSRRRLNSWKVHRSKKGHKGRHQLAFECKEGFIIVKGSELKVEKGIDSKRDSCQFEWRHVGDGLGYMKSIKNVYIGEKKEQIAVCKEEESAKLFRNPNHDSHV